MKKIFTFLLTGISSLGFAQTTATNFTAADCASNTHTLFSELDAGKVVVICWVMPCSNCISGASADAAAAQSFASSYPGRVKFYIVDDAGNSSCSTLTSWESTNSISADATFGNSGNTINMSNYGSSGMPKTVVLGGASHTIYLNVNGTPTSSALQSAINNALNASTGMTEQNNFSHLSLFPNPATISSDVSYSLESSSSVKIEIFNVVGEKEAVVFSGNQNAGEHKFDIDCANLKSGIYFVKINFGKTEKTIKLSVVH